MKRQVGIIRTYDQILDNVGYQVESYGKFHVVRRWQLNIKGDGNAIQYDSYSVNYGFPYFDGRELSTGRYTDQVTAWMEGKTKVIKAGQALNTRSKWPYTVFELDGRYKKSTTSTLVPPTLAESLAELDGVDEDTEIGLDTLPANYSITVYTATMGIKAIQRLAQGSKPWALTVSFEQPHPPYIAFEDYASYYLDRKDQLFIPPNIDDIFDIPAFAEKQRKAWKRGFNNRAKLRSWIAVYYAMVEQFDEWVGKLLDELDAQGLTNNTMGKLMGD